ncbi:flagellin N-terminal-like domain-containing protein [Halorubrum xinjiangense]|uniref:Flagellin N-terminal-like domain-containing protein n=1 Tax=Halorubrum xinjiangense TaxID=261291 RepID=A0A1G7NDG5_9EURY|nr:type IV pilin N-terminal domain-containing protein [Halorubrum xinjiangense]SDF71996.1 flagellin N-terminal-like domain-containing protein [Halorubrum xinjiangense]
MNSSKQSNADDRAVSPVIGVILMVAITVILAAVIGTFVLGLGDQLGDTAPQASFTVEDVSLNNSDQVDVNITKTGGEDLDPSQLTISVDGTRSGTIASNSTVANPWQSGTTAKVGPVGSGFNTSDTVEIRIIHDPSGNAIFEDTATVS